MFGLLERFVMGDSFWLSLNINKYMDAKGFSAWIYSNGLPGNYYSADLYSFVGLIRRLVGFLTDPLLTGHFLAFCTLILLFTSVYGTRKRNNIAIVLFSVVILLTLSKGAILIIAVGFVYKLWRNNRAFAFLAGIFALGALVFLIKGDFLSTVSTHVGGLTSSLSIDYVFGKGLGTSGNYANLYGEGSATNGESYIGAIIGQMGLIGLIVFIYAIVQLLKRIRYIDKSIVSYLVFAYIVGVLIESFVSESAINYVGSGVAFIFFGILYAQQSVHSELLSKSNYSVEMVTGK